ncbi:MAG: RagB/SusD family nutrient uptake outer membrane protein [Sphingobacterium sp.]|jgi:tetratricopeptide (TPR) repeat protein|nr:RagB/SusD family nutrient uptake outer membrane protein [Sphingobacterium sp.]
MKKKVLPIVIGLLVLVALTACNKYLEEKSNKSLVTPSSVEELQGLLDDVVTMNTTTPGFMESFSDDFFLMPSTYNALASLELELYSYKPIPYQYTNDWAKSYLVVYNTNMCLERLENVKLSSSNSQSWRNVKGSALFFRSFYYLDLAWQHAKVYNSSTSATDLGIVLRSSSDFNVKSVRATVQETYDVIIADTKIAASLLPDHPQHVMRPSKAAAYGLLARAYLSMSKPDSAFKYADLALGIKNSLMDYNGDADLNGTVNSTVPFKKFNKEIIFYTEMYTSFSLHLPFRAKIDTTLITTYTADDLRSAAFYKNNSGYAQFKGSYTANSNTLFSGIAVDELLLIRAECHARLGRAQEAMTDLNTLLKKRWKKSVTYPALTAKNNNEALAIILAERRKELIMRGLRWIDIKRLNKEGRNITPTRLVNGKIFTIAPNDNLYALPLPEDIIRLTGIPQN